MAKLTEQLISEFVQTTTPKTDDRNHEFTVTGTVISIGENGVVNVRMDGGEEAPCQSTVGCAVDDRVIVSFKNREPVVTSNITKPVATSEEVNTKVVNAVNIFATNGTFTGTLSAAKGTFTGTVTFDYNVAGGTEHISIGPTNQSEPIEISMTQASGESFKVGIDRSGISVKHHQAYDNRDFTTIISSTGINISGTNAGYCSVGLNGVSMDDGSRLISSSEISAISSHTSTLSSHTSTLSSHTTAISGLQSTISNAILWRGSFKGMNIDSATIPVGFYSLPSSSEYTHSSMSGNIPQYCLFFQSPAYNTQVIFDGAQNPQIMWRDRTGSTPTWSSWQKVRMTT